MNADPHRRPKPPPTEDDGWPLGEPFKADYSVVWLAVIVPLVFALMYALARWTRGPDEKRLLPMNEPKTLGTELPAQMTRVRDQVIPAYVAIGPAGAFALMGMRRDLDEAAKAMAEGDVVAMLRVYQSLKEWHT